MEDGFLATIPLTTWTVGKLSFHCPPNELTHLQSLFKFESVSNKEAGCGRCVRSTLDKRGFLVE
jgi:hypothetical protein